MHASYKVTLLTAKGNKVKVSFLCMFHHMYSYFKQRILD